MKKLIAIVLVCVLAVGCFAACGKKETPTSYTPYTAQDSVADTAAPETTAAGGLSTDWRSGQVMIAGDVITLPMKLSDFMNLGWAPVESLSDKEIDPEDPNIVHSGSLSYIDFQKGGSKITGFINNWTEDRIKAEDGYLSEIHAHADETAATLPGGFEIGKATKSDLLSAWGTTDQSSAINSETVELTYDMDDVGFSIQYNLASEVLTGFGVWNYNETASPAPASQAPVSQAPVTTQAAAAAGRFDILSVLDPNAYHTSDGKSYYINSGDGDFKFDFTLHFGAKTITIPSKLKDNSGWTYQDIEVPGKKEDGTPLKSPVFLKDAQGKEIAVWCVNENAAATPASECKIYEVKIGDTGNSAPEIIAFSFNNGVTSASSAQEILRLMGSPKEFSLWDNGILYLRYYKTGLSSVDFYYDLNRNAIQKVEITHGYQ